MGHSVQVITLRWPWFVAPDVEEYSGILIHRLPVPSSSHTLSWQAALALALLRRGDLMDWADVVQLNRSATMPFYATSMLTSSC